MKEQEFKLKVVKVKEVNLPTKSYAAAGFDFYIPTNLHITDFTKNAEIYANNFINPETEKDYVFSNSKFISLSNDSFNFCFSSFNPLSFDSFSKYLLLSCSSKSFFIFIS